MDNESKDLKMEEKGQEAKKINKTIKKDSETYKDITNRFRVQFDFAYKGSKGETNDGPKHTVPDLNLTVRQLVENHTRGIELGENHKTPMYFETTVPVIKDLTDAEAFRDHVKNQLKEVEAFIENDLNNPATEEKAGKQLDLEEEADKAS